MFQRQIHFWCVVFCAKTGSRSRLRPFCVCVWCRRSCGPVRLSPRCRMPRCPRTSSASSCSRSAPRPPTPRLQPATTPPSWGWGVRRPCCGKERQHRHVLARERGHPCRVSCSRQKRIFLKNIWEYDTLGSQVITDLSTNRACGCLTSQIGRDVVLSTKCGRTQKSQP